MPIRSVEYLLSGWARKTVNVFSVFHCNQIIRSDNMCGILMSDKMSLTMMESESENTGH